MNFLVTGGAGFIGSHLVERLLEYNHDITVIDDLSSGFISNLPKNGRIKFIQKPVQDVAVEEFAANVSIIFHLATQVSVPISIDQFFDSSSRNLLSTLKIFELARTLNVPVVYASSSAVYGNLPLGDDDSDRYDILSPYAQDKLTMEDYARLCHKLYRTPSIGLRFFNVYGPKQDPTNPYSGVISIFIDRMLNKIPVTVNGGYQTRDFIYVADIVDILVRSMSLLLNQNLCQVINVGTGNSVTIDDLLRALKKIIQLEPEIIRKKLPFGDPERSSGTFEKLESLLGVVKKNFTPIPDGLAKTVTYIQLTQNHSSQGR